MRTSFKYPPLDAICVLWQLVHGDDESGDAHAEANKLHLVLAGLLLHQILKQCEFSIQTKLARSEFFQENPPYELINDIFLKTEGRLSYIQYPASRALGGPSRFGRAEF